MSVGDLHVVVPGSLRQRTGGYVYDARIVDGLRTLGWHVTVHELAGRFPDADDQARASLAEVLSGIPGGGRVVVDGLAMGGLPGPITAHTGRLQILSLVHHLLADETGLESARRQAFLTLEQDALNACVGVLVTSAFTASRLLALGIPSARVRAVRPGIDRAPVARGVARGQPPCLLCVASVTPRKGQDVLVRALGYLKHLSWRCVCAGSLDRAPLYADEVRKQAEALGVHQKIAFVGERDDAQLSDLYDVSSLFVLPSHFEGYGMVLADALARGLPIVSTRAGAIPDTVPPEAGVLVPPGDDRALADAIGALIRSPSRLQGMGAAARRASEGLPSWDDAAAAFSLAIQELVPDPDAMMVSSNDVS